MSDDAIELFDEADLRALVERSKNWPASDAKEIEIVVAEVLARRKVARAETRRDVMMMAAAIVSELTHEYEIKNPEQRVQMAQLAVALAFEIEKATPR